MANSANTHQHHSLRDFFNGEGYSHNQHGSNLFSGYLPENPTKEDLKKADESLNKANLALMISLAVAVFGLLLSLFTPTALVGWSIVAIGILGTGFSAAWVLLGATKRDLLSPLDDNYEDI